MIFRLLPLFTVLFISLVPVFAGSEKKNFSGGEMTKEEFLSIVRNPPGRRSWASMEGTAIHRREGTKPIKAPLYLGLLFTPEQTIAQLDFNKGEIYNIGQMLGKNAKTILTKKFPASRKAQLPLYGIEPHDLTMSFLYWPLLREESPERIKGQKCRNFILKQNEKNGKYLRVFINENYFFPMKAEFFHRDPAKEKSPYKTLEIVSFSQKDRFWYPGKIRLEGKNWKSMISFDKLDADENNKRLPENLFRK